MNILKTIYRILPFIAAALTIGFLGWLMSLHGTLGLFHINSLFRSIFIIILIAAVVLTGLAVWQIIISRKSGRSPKIWIILPVVLLTAMEIIFPLAGILNLSTPLSPPSEVNSPQLLLSDRQSETGVPDVAVIHYTSEPVRETLKWGTSDSSSVITENTTTKQHVFILTNLTPDTDYRYQINNGTIYNFKTPDISNDSLHFALFSDAHYEPNKENASHMANMFSYIAKTTNDYNYIFSAGDLVDFGFSDTQWQIALQDLTPAISNIPAALIAGNHDTLFTGLEKYKYYCYPPELESASGSRLWHRYDIGKVHFICLNIEWSAECFTAEQATWLEAQLKSIPEDDWKIVISHGYYYASGSVINGWKWYDNPETIEAITPLFEKYGVDMVFSGHVHQMELLQHAGVTYVIAGTFGGSLEPDYTYKSPDSLWYTGNQYGFTDVTVDTDTAEIVFRDPAYQALKSFTLNK